MQCIDCYRRTIDEDTMDNYCMEARRDIVEDVMSCPDWCPLKDKKEDLPTDEDVGFAW